MRVCRITRSFPLLLECRDPALPGSAAKPRGLFFARKSVTGRSRALPSSSHQGGCPTLGPPLSGCSVCRITRSFPLLLECRNPPLPGSAAKPRWLCASAQRKTLGQAEKMNKFIFSASPKAFLLPGSSLCVYQATGAVCLLLLPSRFAWVGCKGESPCRGIIRAAEALIVSSPPVLRLVAARRDA